jgi:hypothetical protein
MSSLAVFALIAVGVLASIDLLAVFVSGNLLGWMSQVRVRHANGHTSPERILPLFENQTNQRPN